VGGLLTRNRESAGNWDVNETLFIQALEVFWGAEIAAVPQLLSRLHLLLVFFARQLLQLG